jgi:hypothetical protein
MRLVPLLVVLSAAIPAIGHAESIDSILAAARQGAGVEPAGPCSDGVFLRRAYVDLIGTLPTAAEARAFLADGSADKRARLIDALLARPEFADYWALKWCDVLRVKSEFPINLWPDAVQRYHAWVRDCLRRNMPYDQFARELLTSSGSCFRVPAANFYRAVQQRDPAGLAGAVALTFMGARADAWPEAQRTGMAAFFSRVAYKKTEEWKEEIVCMDPAPAGPVSAVFPDGTAVTIPAGEDPRLVFADWLTRSDNPWFPRAAVNRVWGWVFGRGIVDPVDDIRPGNPASCPELLSYLTRQFVASDYDLRALYRLICNSGTYQQSPVPKGKAAEAPGVFACYPVRRLDAEVLIDALCATIGGAEDYSSAIPEPFTYIPDRQRTILLADGSITSPFLEMFGRPTRDTGLESERGNAPTDAQRLYLLNSADIQRRIERSPQLRFLLASTRGRPREQVSWLYLALLSRYPTEDEVTAAQRYVAAHAADPKAAVDDLVWALINTKEFLFRH